MNCIVNLLVLLGSKTSLRIFPFNYKICEIFKCTNHGSHFLKKKQEEKKKMLDKDSYYLEHADQSKYST